MNKPLTIGSAFLYSASRTPTKTAIRVGARTWTYGDLKRRVTHLAAALAESDYLKPHDAIAVALPNGPDFIIGMLAITTAGMIVVPVPSNATPAEIAVIVSHSRSHAILSSRPIVGDAGRPEGYPFTEPTYITAVPDADLSRGEPIQFSPADDSGTQAAILSSGSDIAFRILTGGTTGAPKVVEITNTARACLSHAYARSYDCYRQGAHAIVATPLHHGAGISRSLAPLFTSGELELTKRYDPEYLYRRIATGSVTSIFGVPTILHDLVGLATDRGARTTATEPFVFITSAAPATAELRARCKEVLPRALIYDSYGTTEAGSISVSTPADFISRRGTVGRPMSNVLVKTMRVRDRGSGSADIDGEEILVKSPFLFHGYLGQTENRIDEEGYYHTGDLGVLSDDGYLTLIGRISDYVITGGVNVYTREVADTLRGCAGVGDAIVFGYPDDRLGMKLLGVVVRSPNKPHVTEAEVLEYARARLSGLKVPKAVLVVNELPRKPTGKPDIEVIARSLGLERG